MELIQIAARRKEFEANGTKVMVADEKVLRKIMNKHNLLTEMEKNEVEVGQFEMLSDSIENEWANKKVVIKPTSGSGSRGVEIHDHYNSIDEEKRSTRNIMIQEFFEGPEYSVDVMVNKNGEVKAAVPRVRMRTDSGVSVTGLVENNPLVIEYAKRVAKHIGLTFAGNIQIILDPKKGPRLVEINPRFSGGLSLVIEAGANAPVMCVKELLNEEVNEVKEFKEIAMVRSYTESYMMPGDLMVA